MQEVRRQAIHLIAFSLCALMVFYLPLQLVIFAVSFCLACAIIGGLAVKFGLEERIFPKGFRPISSIYYRSDKGRASAKKFPFYGAIIGLAGILASLLIVGSRAYIPILILAWGDSASTLVGIYFGRTKLIAGRSLEGAIGFFLVSLIPLFIATPLSEGKIFFLALAATLTEILSPIDDNLTIPIVSSFLIKLLA